MFLYHKYQIITDLDNVADPVGPMWQTKHDINQPSAFSTARAIT